MAGVTVAEREALTRFEDSENRVQGWVAPGYEHVADAFCANFAQGEEIGAACAITIEGRPVADLWGGWQDAGKTRPWLEDTLVCQMSVAKGPAATCLHMMADRGAVDFEAPVTAYWPEFGAHGKDRVKVRQLLDHTAGVPVVDAPIAALTIYDDVGMENALASQPPLWEPGSDSGYHVLSMGFLIGAIVRRVDGRSVGRFFREEVAAPLGLDYQIGLNAEEIARCADFVKTIEGTLFDEKIVDPTSLSARAWAQVPKEESFNSQAWRTAEVPGANGHGDARSIARFYAALVCGEVDGVRLLSDAAFERAISEQWFRRERVLGREYHMSMGYLLNSAPFIDMGPNPRSFGHHGMGGSIGFGDPDAKIGFCYATNRMHARLDNGPRAGSIIHALYRTI